MTSLRRKLELASLGPVDQQLQETVLLGLHSATVIHLYHFATRSHAQHKALDEYYNGIVEEMDKLVESYQGLTDNRIIIPDRRIYTTAALDLAELSPSGVIHFVHASLGRLKVMCSTATRNEDENISYDQIINLIEESQAFCSKILYLLTLD